MDAQQQIPEDNKPQTRPEEPHERNMKVREIVFENGNRARVIAPPAGTKAEEILQALDLKQPKALIMVAGGAGNLDKRLASDRRLASRLIQLFSRGIARAAADDDALIITGGTHSGVMKLMGEGVADRGRKSILLGVAPAGLVTYPGRAPEEGVKADCPLDPNHTHSVLVDSDEWGGETDLMYQLAEALESQSFATATSDPASESRGTLAKILHRGQKKQDTAETEDAAAAAPEKIPVVQVLVDSPKEGIAKDEVLRSVRHNWPIVVVEGSGPLADEIARLRKREGRKSRWWSRWWSRLRPREIVDPVMAEIVEDGDVRIFSRKSRVVELAPLLHQLLRRAPSDVNLLLAWQRFAQYDKQAKRFRNQYYFLRKWILRVAVTITFFVVLKSVLPDAATIDGWTLLTEAQRTWLKDAVPTLDRVLYFVVLILPILSSIIIAMESLWKPGNKWILLRKSAETVKRAIFKYRARLDLPDSGQAAQATGGQETAAGAGELQTQVTPEAKLAGEVESISQTLMQSDVNLAAMPAYVGPLPPGYEHTGAKADDGFSRLTPEQYMERRLDDQLEFYQDRTSVRERDWRLYRGAAIVVGGLGTFLAAVRLDPWVAVTTALATALVGTLEYKQTEDTLIQYNQSATNLKNVKGWWMALSREEKADPRNVVRLIDVTEQILATEQHGWVQEMQDALAALREEVPETEDEI